MMTPHDFHRMIGLRCDGTLINLGGVSGVQLGIDLLKRRYSMDTIRYYDIKTDYRPFLQVTVDTQFCTHDLIKENYWNDHSYTPKIMIVLHALTCSLHIIKMILRF